jgi:hypothetical protein
MAPPPLLVLGVRRSGTTLLRVMLDRNPDIAVPDESYFIPPLAARYRGEVDPARFEDDLRRFRVLAKWGVDPAAVRARLHPGITAAGAIAAIYETYAADRGKARWGDKTPLYMSHLTLLDQLFPDARYVHVIRDGRDAARSFLAMPRGVMTEGWGHPRDAAGFACQWRTEVLGARELGGRVGPERYVELRYESLVADPAAELAGVCTFAGLPWDPGMLDYAGSVDVSAKPHHRRLQERPPPARATGGRRWLPRTWTLSSRSPATCSRRWATTWPTAPPPPARRGGPAPA